MNVLKKIKPVLVLSIICTLICALLIVTYNLTYVDTSGVLTDNLKAGCIAADGEGEYALITDKAAAKLDGIDAVIAIDKNGAVSGISIIALGETPGLGSKINDDAFLQRFYGVKSDISIVKSEPKNENEVQGITGSTLSSKGMAKAVNLAVKAYSVMDKEVQPNE